MGLHVALDAQRGGVLAHERPVRLEPVFLELLARQAREPAQAEAELDHGRERTTTLACGSLRASLATRATRSRALLLGQQRLEALLLGRLHVRVARVDALRL